MEFIPVRRMWSGYLDPRPTPGSIGQAYSKYYTHGNAVSVEKPPTSRWRQYRVAQRNAYLNERYGYRLKPVTSQGPRRLSAERRQRFDKYVCFLPYPGEGSRVLDMGSGNGRMMMQLRSAGWEVSGIEPNPKAAAQAIAAGLNVKVGLLDDSLPEANFDAVTLSHVIERLHEPVDTLKKCARVLKPGGVICIVTPNFAASGHSLFARDWFALDAPRHLVMFTPGALRRALELSGFDPEYHANSSDGPGNSSQHQLVAPQYADSSRSGSDARPTPIAPKNAATFVLACLAGKSDGSGLPRKGGRVGHARAAIEIDLSS